MVSALMETVGRQARESSTDTLGRKTEVLHGTSHEPRDPGVSGGWALVDLEDPNEPGVGETGMRGPAWP